MAADTVTTTVTELPESRVRLEVEVTPQELQRRVNETAAKLGRDLRLPGFRKGKVPPPVVVKQLGREAVLDETIRGQLGRWYLDAIEHAKVHPVGDPDLNMEELPAQGAPFQFSIEIGVRPTAQLGDYKGVSAPKREAKADEAAVQAELDQLREQGARLESKDGAAAEGDFVVMDYKGYVEGEPFEGGEGRDQLIELGSGRLIPGFEEQITGATSGEERTISVEFPDDYHATHLAGKPATFELQIKDVKAKEMPALDDEFASDSAGFDTLDELKEDIAAKLRETEETKIEGEFREAALDAVVAGATLEVPDALVEARAKELWDRMLGTLQQQGIDKDTYLRIAGKDEESLLAEARPDAEQALRREAVIAAIVEAEDLKPADGDVLEALQASAVQEQTTPEKLRDRLQKAGRLEELMDDLAQRMAVDLVAEHATAVPAPDPEPEAEETA
ncbi:MAG: tig [Solirubrobacterales bacterium]|jgi:trigger factor|nr:tig [Solirubrobacterales bacterium]